MAKDYIPSAAEHWVDSAGRYIHEFENAVSLQAFVHNEMVMICLDVAVMKGFPADQELTIA